MRSTRPGSESALNRDDSRLPAGFSRRQVSFGVGWSAVKAIGGSASAGRAQGCAAARAVWQGAIGKSARRHRRWRRGARPALLGQEDGGRNGFDEVRLQNGSPPAPAEAASAGAGGDIALEDALHQVGPTHSGGAEWGRRNRGGLSGGLGQNVGTIGGGVRENPKGADHVESRGRHQRAADCGSHE